MNSKRAMQIEKAKLGRADHGELALLGWELVAGIVTLIAIVSIVGMLPELVRYLKIKSM